MPSQSWVAYSPSAVSFYSLLLCAPYLVALLELFQLNEASVVIEFAIVQMVDSWIKIVTEFENFLVTADEMKTI